MKWTLGISLVLSISLNVVLIYDDVRNARNRAWAESFNRSSLSLEVNKTTWKKGINMIQTKLQDGNKHLLKKKYYYINIWTNWCKPCIKEMPWLDSIANTLNKDVGYVYLTDIHDTLANATIRKKNYHFKNFILLNNMNDFVSGLCNERKIKNKVYPTVLILNDKGEIVYFSTGAYSNKREAADFAALINKLE